MVLKLSANHFFVVAVIEKYDCTRMQACPHAALGNHVGDLSPAPLKGSEGSRVGSRLQFLQNDPSCFQGVLCPLTSYLFPMHGAVESVRKNHDVMQHLGRN